MCIKDLLFQYALSKFSQTKSRGSIEMYRYHELASQKLHDELLEKLKTTREDKDTQQWIAEKTEKLIEYMEGCSHEAFKEKI